MSDWVHDLSAAISNHFRGKLVYVKLLPCAHSLNEERARPKVHFKLVRPHFERAGHKAIVYNTPALLEHMLLAIK